MRYLPKPSLVMMAVCCLSTFPLLGYAQTPPDAGRLLQDTLPESDYQPRPPRQKSIYRARR
ncbi:hypothetical protein HORIV_08470 [Vreelandella olivaria]|uniref:Uncharacterized protein n=1 Tax=Vreelandella olivaria TaxID=390919 RepID=A0ABN5WN52_9GAMM|nr:hypothetical protein HORIV_08470 [Halomonas olivaria]